MPGFIHYINQRLHDEGHWLTRKKILLFGLTVIIAGLLLGLFEDDV